MLLYIVSVILFLIFIHVVSPCIIATVLIYFRRACVQHGMHLRTSLSFKPFLTRNLLFHLIILDIFSLSLAVSQQPLIVRVHLALHYLCLRWWMGLVWDIGPPRGITPAPRIA